MSTSRVPGAHLGNSEAVERRKNTDTISTSKLAEGAHPKPTMAESMVQQQVIQEMKSKSIGSMFGIPLVRALWMLRGYACA